MRQEIISEITVLNEGLIQGLVKYNHRQFWYECDMSSQELLELQGDLDKFDEIDSTCLCDALGETHIEWRNDGQLNSCDGIWSDDINLHTLIAGMCLTVLLTRKANKNAS